MTLHHRLEILLGVSLVLSLFSWGRRVLFPFQIFTTWVHECCHGVTALILGGKSISISLSTDGSGLTHFRIPEGRLRHGIIASAGYLGASLSGCLIFALAVHTEKASHFLSVRTMVISLCGSVLLSLVFWIRNVFGFFSVLILAGALASLNYSPIDHYAHEVILFLAIQTGLNALFDIRTLFGFKSSKANMSDAHTLQKLFFLPYWCWGLSWLVLSLAMMLWTVQHTI